MPFLPNHNAAATAGDDIQPFLLFSMSMLLGKLPRRAKSLYESVCLFVCLSVCVSIAASCLLFTCTFSRSPSTLSTRSSRATLFGRRLVISLYFLCARSRAPREHSTFGTE